MESLGVGGGKTIPLAPGALASCADGGSLSPISKGMGSGRGAGSGALATLEGTDLADFERRMLVRFSSVVEMLADVMFVFTSVPFLADSMRWESSSKRMPISFGGGDDLKESDWKRSGESAASLAGLLEGVEAPYS